MTVRIGTASWTDKTLIACGRFYPKDCQSAEQRLRYYASRFPLVEVDSSYYAIPAPATAQLWAERTPSDFVMNVKAFRLFTGHQTQPGALHRDIQQRLPPGTGRNLYYKDLPDELIDALWLRFIEALLPLKAAGKLGLVHFQFPPWLTCNRAGHAHVEHCVQRMAGHTLSIEFRHRSWFGDKTTSTLAFERELGVVHTVVDAPQGFSNSVPAVWEVTRPDYALVRLHGRNSQTWDIEGTSTSASDRFNYDYPSTELADLAARTLRLDGMAANTHVVFNNNMEDQGQRNAQSLMELMGIVWRRP